MCGHFIVMEIKTMNSTDANSANHMSSIRQELLQQQFVPIDITFVDCRDSLYESIFKLIEPIDVPCLQNTIA